MTTIELLGDKSISHRVAMLASLADDACTISNYNTGADCASTLQCLRELGTEMKDRLKIIPRPLRSPVRTLDCGNSGSTMRILTGLLAGQQISAQLSGDSSLLKRPMKRVAEPLREMGAVIELQNGDFAPIQLKEGTKKAIQYTMPVSSAQVKTAIIFAGLKFSGTQVIETIPSRDHTERLLHYLQIQPGPSVRFPGFTYHVPGDPSSAALLVVAALLHNKELVLRNVLLNRYRIAFLNILKEAGAPVSVVDERMQQNETVGDIHVYKGSLKNPITISGSEVASLIDEIPALTMAGLTHGIEIRGAKELRLKESDRIRSMTSNLTKLGIEVQEWEDGYQVKPGRIISGEAQTFGDHRIAMAFASAGISIDDSECVKISFPEFFELLKKILES